MLVALPLRQQWVVFTDTLSKRTQKGGYINNLG